MLAIIGGTGLNKLANLEITHRQVLRTPYGEPSGALTFGTIGEQEIMFLARHGYNHSILPHLVNYRANLWALREQGASHILSVASVGGIRADLVPGTIVIPNQLLDYTHDREHTFFDGKDFEGKESGAFHIDFTRPYTDELRQKVLASARALGESCVDGGVYAATQGPRLETAAEINRFERDGADMVGMTGMPEAALARELGLSYATIAVVVNAAAGRGNSPEKARLEGISEVAQAAMVRVRNLIAGIVAGNEPEGVAP